jgi:hypothetical protein
MTIVEVGDKEQATTTAGPSTSLRMTPPLKFAVMAFAKNILILYGHNERVALILHISIAEDQIFSKQRQGNVCLIQWVIGPK